MSNPLVRTFSITFETPQEAADFRAKIDEFRLHHFNKHKEVLTISNAVKTLINNSIK